jgi:predicted ATPase/DNA-binding XRE family transcriptional regulator
VDTETSFGAWLRQRRKQLDLTRAQLAQRIGYSVSALRKLETDERRPSKQIADLLAEALDIPAAQRALFLQVARGERRVARLGAATAHAIAEHAPLRPTSNLPLPATVLVGREVELMELSHLLSDPQCRLLTLVGPGGIGKTRLAIAAAAAHRETFDNQLYFVALAGVDSPDRLVSAIAEALGFAFFGQDPPKRQLVNHLRRVERTLLLVLDNLEQLLAHATSAAEPSEADTTKFLADVLAVAPNVKWLVTSRERLNLQSEWVFEVQGLPVPPQSQAGELENYSAVELFLRCARRAQQRFTLKPADGPHLAHICRLVDGMPLGIELAATWVRTLSCAEIAHELTRNLDFLATTARDVPQRHRSLRAVFDHSWQWLTDEERTVLGQLSVFRGGFSRAAAAQVAGATLMVLSALLDKSLVRRASTQAERYELHELIRQYAAAKLATAVQHDTQARHSSYYLDWLAQRDASLRSNRQKDVLLELTTELDNLHAAWDWAAAQRQSVRLYQAAPTLWYLWELRSSYAEAETIFRHAVETLQVSGETDESEQLSQQIALYALTAHRAFFSFRLGKSAEAYATLLECVVRLRAYPDSAALSYTLWYLGVVCWLLGRLAEANETLRECLALARTKGERWYEMLSGYYLGLAVHEQGSYHEAQRCLSEALALARQLGDMRMISYGLNFLCRTKRALGAHAEVEALLREGLTLARELDDRYGIAMSLHGLAQTAHIQGRLNEAHTMFVESSAMFKAIGDPWSLARILYHRGLNSLSLDDSADAQICFHTALQVATEGNFMPPALNALTGLALVQAKQGDEAKALELVLQVLSHPASGSDTQAVATPLRAELEAKLTPAQAQAAQAAVSTQTFEQMVAHILQHAGRV